MKEFLLTSGYLIFKIATCTILLSILLVVLVIAALESYR